MMNIKDAQAKVNAYITKNVESILATIETAIVESAEQGKVHIEYSFDRKTNQNMEIEKRVLSALSTAGYQVRWLNNGALGIAWAI